MTKKIVWSPSAENDFANILDYLNNQWNATVANQFIDLTENILIQISINPKQYPIIHKIKEVRRCVLTKHNSLYYQLKNNQVDILRIYDTRQVPDNLRF